MLALDLLNILKLYPDLARTLKLDDIITFVELARHVKDRIEFSNPAYNGRAPDALPMPIATFLADALQVSLTAISVCWTALRGYVWDLVDSPARANYPKYVPLFLRHGIKAELGFLDLYPPTRICLDTRCDRETRTAGYKPRALGNIQYYRVVVFTADAGPIPSWHTSLYCNNCHTRYHHDFFIHTNASIRSYYPNSSLPSVLQVSMHAYMERRLCEEYSENAVFAWMSATNFGRMYNSKHAANAHARLLPTTTEWRFSLELDCQLVSDGFFLNALVLDHWERKTALELDHTASSQAVRLRAALEARNNLMAGTGQEHWSHVCDMCCKPVTTPDGGIQSLYLILCYGFIRQAHRPLVLRSVVTDGITLGYPCCKVADCKERLVGSRAHYCASHESHSGLCAVAACQRPVRKGYRACDDPNHVKIESDHVARGQAMFQLRQRLKNLRMSQTNDSISASLATTRTDEEIEGPGIMSDGETPSDTEDCPEKPTVGNRARKAYFNRRRTHNEVICVASCGVFLGRCTMYASESTNGVINFWKCLFPTQQSLPQIMWYDNNCNVQRVLKNPMHPDHYFDCCCLPVDVFHFKCKHSTKDEFCGQHCNPALFKELYDDTAKQWRFNSSAAEQANAWLGGYQSITREMLVERYNFFLDEMIKRRNRYIVKTLQTKKKTPFLIDRNELLRE